MKPLHIVLLVCAGALGGAVVTKVWQKHPAPATPPIVAQVQQPATPASQTPVAAAPQAAPAATAKDEQKSSAPAASVPAEKPKTKAPVAPPASAGKAAGHPERTGGAAPPKFHKNPPPAHPRPLVLGQATPPASQAPVPLIVPPLTAPASAPAQEAPPVQQAEPATAPPANSVEPEAPHKVTLNAGMLIPVRLVDGLSSDRNVPGDTFTGTLDRELVVDGFIIAERGARVEGRVVTSDHGSRVRGDAAIAVELTRIHTSDGQNVAIQTDSFERRSTANHATDAAKVGGGAVLGAIIGAIAGGGKGAAIGAGAGGGVGAGDVLLTRKPATLPSEMRIRFRLRTSVTLTEKRG